MQTQTFTACQTHSVFNRSARKGAKSDCQPRHLCLPAWNISAPTGRIFIKFDTSVFLENLSRKLKFRCSLTRVTGALREDLCTFVIIPA